MNSTISCPSCQRMLRVPESLLGQAVKCPSCSHTFTAPENLEEVAPRRAAAPPPKDDYEEEDYEEVPRRRRRREKPSKVQAIGIMMLIGGILATLGSAGLIAYCGLIGIATLGVGFLCCLWPGPYYGLTMGIMAIIKGSRLLGEKANRETSPQGIAIMMIINIINGDLVNLVLGIVILVFLNDEEVKDYFR